MAIVETESIDISQRKHKFLQAGSGKELFEEIERFLESGEITRERIKSMSFREDPPPVILVRGVRWCGGANTVSVEMVYE